MSNVTECYKALEGAVPVVQTSPFSELLLAIGLVAAYLQGFEDGWAGGWMERDELT